MTKTHSNKDQRITIDDYFHVEDHREWTFFIGKEDLITPWWDKDAAKIPLSCIFLMGWPFRMAYEGRIAKHQVGTLLLNWNISDCDLWVIKDNLGIRNHCKSSDKEQRGLPSILVIRIAYQNCVTLFCRLIRIAKLIPDLKALILYSSVGKYILPILCFFSGLCRLECIKVLLSRMYGTFIQRC